MDNRTMLQKWKTNAPYHIFFNVIPAIPDTSQQTNAINFTDLLCPSLGKLECSLQFTSFVDFDWLFHQYEQKGVESLPVTVIAKNPMGHEKFSHDKFTRMEYYPMPIKENPHHSKSGIYAYEDGSLRLVVSTANLCEKDWDHYNQALWISPACPVMRKGTDGESPTGFKSDIIEYLESYKLPLLETWIERVKNADFSDIRVFLVSSVPGIHDPDARKHRCHRFTVGSLLKKYCHLPPETTPKAHKEWKVIAQASNIGVLKRKPKEFLLPILGFLTNCKELSLTKYAEFCFVYPTERNSRAGHMGADPNYNTYTAATEDKQQWFRQYLYQWKADRLNRSRVMPQIKNYARVSPCLTKLAYYLLTSANFTRAAWGTGGSAFSKSRSIEVMAHELGVLFLPQFFNEEYFEIEETGNNENRTLFPFMCDLPLTKYDDDDEPLLHV